MILTETYTLANGVAIPKLGLGTWLIENDKAAEAVRSAVQAGYRHIDTAQAYQNEAGVGEGVRTCGVERSELFITSKVAAEHKSYEAAAQSIDETLARMKLDYLDMMIIHSPQPWAEWRGTKRYFEENKEVWRALEEAYNAGKLRAIGLSNFLVDDMQSLLPACTIKPHVNQVLAHIGNVPEKVVQYAQEHGILIEAYSPIAHGKMLHAPEITKAAQKYGVTPAQLCIRYTLQRGFVSLPKSANFEHIKSNAELDFEITQEDMNALSALKDFFDYGDDSRFPVFSGK